MTDDVVDGDHGSRTFSPQVKKLQYVLHEGSGVRHEYKSLDSI